MCWDQSWLGLQPQSLHFTIICCPGVTQISRWLPEALSAGAAGMLLGRIHMHIHCIWRLSNTLHVSDIDVGSILIGSTASITALHHHLLPRTYQSSQAAKGMPQPIGKYYHWSGYDKFLSFLVTYKKNLMRKGGKWNAAGRQSAYGIFRTWRPERKQWVTLMGRVHQHFCIRSFLCTNCSTVLACEDVLL
jgi:hypothetical protein